MVILLQNYRIKVDLGQEEWQNLGLDNTMMLDYLFIYLSIDQLIILLNWTASADIKVWRGGGEWGMTGNLQMIAEHCWNIRAICCAEINNQ